MPESPGVSLPGDSALVDCANSSSMGIWTYTLMIKDCFRNNKNKNNKKQQNNNNKTRTKTTTKQRKNNKKTTTTTTTINHQPTTTKNQQPTKNIKQKKTKQKNTKKTTTKTSGGGKKQKTKHEKWKKCCGCMRWDVTYTHAFCARRTAAGFVSHTFTHALHTKDDTDRLTYAARFVRVICSSHICLNQTWYREKSQSENSAAKCPKLERMGTNTQV